MTKTIAAVVGAVDEPVLGGTLDDNGIVAECNGEGDAARVLLRFPYPAKAQQKAVVAECHNRLRDNGIAADIRAEVVIHARTVQGGVQLIDGIKNIIAVASGKGGVGKSTTAANLALALSAEGARVGILDADIYGPSLPVMLGINRRPDGDDKGITPLMAHGLQLMSIGYLVGEDQPMIWRGPMATRALMQLLRETKWDNLDYLFLDMPPGTGDIQLTIAQQAPVTGAIVVTTPQDLALTDAKKGLVMFNKVSIPVLGVVENMSVYVCGQCGAAAEIFGRGAGEKLAKDYGAELLGQLPLDINIRAAADGGKPSVVAEPDGNAAQLYRQTAIRAAAKIAQKTRDRSSAFPKVVINKG
ncbi:MAG: iron-sulfur cluster carrier protein ApbC [Gammaproteobacteria bacterium]